MQSSVTTSSDNSTPCCDSEKHDAEAGDLREKIEKMKERERRIMELLKASSPERIEHDLRNVLNELGLLKMLFRPKSDN